MLSIIHAEVWYERDQGIFIHSGGVLPLGRVGAAGQSVLRRGADPRRVPVRAFMGDPGKREKAVRPALSGTVPRFRQDKHLTDSRLHLNQPQKGSERYDLRRDFLPPIFERRRCGAGGPDKKIRQSANPVYRRVSARCPRSRGFDAECTVDVDVIPRTFVSFDIVHIPNKKSERPLRS